MMGAGLDAAAQIGKPEKEGFVPAPDRPWAGHVDWKFPENAQHIPVPPPDPIDLLPIASQAKLRRLEWDAKEASGASAAVNSEIRFLRDHAREQRDKAAEAAYQAKEDRAYRPRAEAAERAAASAEAQLKAAQAREAAANDRANTVGGLLSSVRDFIANLGGMTVIEIEAPTIRKIPADIPAEIEAKRRRLRELQADRRRVEVAPWPAADSKAALHQQLLSLAAAPDVGPLVDGRGGKIAFAPSFHHGVGPDAFKFVLWLLHDLAVEKIGELIDQFAQPPEDALGETDRRQMLEQIAGDMLEVERSECALIELAAERGLQISHRADVNPQAYLGVRLEGIKI